MSLARAPSYYKLVGKHSAFFLSSPVSLSDRDSRSMLTAPCCAKMQGRIGTLVGAELVTDASGLHGRS